MQMRLLCLLILMSIALSGSFGCGKPHTDLSGTWVHPLGANTKAGMVYEFRPDGTMSEYSQVDLRSQFPQAGITSSTKFNGIYTFSQNTLICHPTSVGDKGQTEALPDTKVFDKKFQVALNGDTLRLSEIRFSQIKPTLEYTRQ